MTHQPFVIERTFNTAADKVWKAITDKTEMKKWHFDLTEFKAEVGFEFRFTGRPSPDIQYLHVCKITEVVVNKKLKHSWCYEGYNGESFVTFELFAEGDKTKLVLTHTGLEAFPANNKDFGKENFVTGWTHIIGTSLNNFLEN